MISLETAPAGGGARADPARAPMNKTANPRTIHRVRKGNSSFLKSACFDFRGWAAATLIETWSSGSATAEPEAPKRLSRVLVGHYKVRAAILLPASFRALVAERPLFAPAHRVNSPGLDSQ